MIKKRLELQGIKVIECKYEIQNSILSLIPAYMKLMWKHRKLDYDIIIIPRWRGALALPLAKILSRKPIVYCVFASPYDIFISDRKMFKPNSFQAKFISFWYKWCLKLSDIIIKESFVDIDYNSEKFIIDKKKFVRIFLSADESLFQPCNFKNPQTDFTVLYFGKFIPLHGVDVIINASKLLSHQKEIKFRLCGDGQMKNEMEKLVKKYNLKNIEFLGHVDDNILMKNINESDVCLGIFGNSTRAKRVATNKVYQILCSQKPLITMNSEAVREIGLENEKNALLISENDPGKLADSILYLKNKPETRKKIARAGRELYLERLSMEKTSKEIRNLLQTLSR